MASSRIKGITIEIGGNTTKLTESLKQVNTTLRTTQTALRDVDKLLKLDPTNTELLRQKQAYLAKEIEATKEKLQQEKLALQQMKDASTTDEVTEEQRALEREIIETERRLSDLEDEMKDFGSVGKQQIQAVADKIGAAGSKISEIGQKISEVGKTLTTHVSAPIAALGVVAAKSFAEVDKTMHLVNATMGNTAEQAEMLNDAMKEAASNSTFGMSEAAEATLNFARAGLTAEEAASALAPAMNLAAGEGGELATVSAGLVATINGFGDSFAATEEYADIFAAACNNSALSINQLVSSMSIAAPVFKAAGYSVQDATLYMGVMANAGIDANTAATALKTGLARLAKPSAEASKAIKELGIEIFDADGNMKDSVTVQRELHKAFADLSAQEQLAAASAIFGKNQMSNWLALINTAPEDVMTLSASLRDCAGTTDEMAEAMMSGFGGSIEKLKSSLDVLSTSFGELIGAALLPIVEKVQELVDWLNSLDTETKETIVQVAAVAAVVGPLVLIIGKILEGLGALLMIVPKIVSTLLAMPPQVMAVIAVLGVLVSAYIALEDAMRKFDEEQERVHDQTRALSDEQKNLVNSCTDVAEATRKSAESRKADRDAMDAQKTLVSKLTNELKGYTDANGNVVKEQGRAKEIINELNTIMPELNLQYDEQAQAVSMTADEIERYTDALLQQAEAAAVQEQLTEIMKERIEVETQLTMLEDEATAARQRAEEAATAYHEALAVLNETENMTSQEIEAQKALVEELNIARQNEALAASEVLGPYGDLQARLTELGQEQDILIDKVGQSSEALDQGGDAALAAAADYGEAAGQISSSWDELREATEKSIASQISLFDEYKAQQAISTQELLKNMTDQVNATQEWSNNLQELAKKGISEGLLQELTKMGPEGAAKVAAFNSMTGPELAKASQLFDEATKIPAETIANVEQNYADLGQKEHDAYNQSVENGVSVTRQKTLNSWQNVGEGVPTGVINGIKNETNNVKKTISDMDDTMIDTATDELEIHSPSKVFQEIGENIPLGVEKGVQENQHFTLEAVREMSQEMIDIVAEALQESTFFDIGAQVGNGLAAGMEAALPRVQAAAAALAAAAETAARAALQVQSPSKVFEYIGEMTGEGFGKGMAESLGNIDEILNSYLPNMNSVHGSLTTNNVTNSMPINISIVSSEGQNVEDLAQEAADRISDEVGRMRAAWGY